MHNWVMIKLTWVLLFWSVILHHSFMVISKPLLVILGLVYCSTVRKHTNSVLGDAHEITKTTHFICLGQIGSDEGSTASISFGFHNPLTWIPLSYGDTLWFCSEGSVLFLAGHYIPPIHWQKITYETTRTTLHHF